MTSEGSGQHIIYDRITNNGGIESKSISITDIENYQLGTIAPSSTVYTIAFRFGTGLYSEAPKQSQSGESIDQTLTVFVPKHRASMELLRNQLQDKRVLLEVTDINGDVHLMYRAKLSISYTTGRKRTDDNGYTITARAVSLMRAFEPTFIQESLLIEEGVTEGSQFGEGTTPLGNTTSLAAEDIYFTVVNTPLSIMPTATDNPEAIRNKIVIGPDYSKWAIDIEGRGIMLESAKLIKYILGNGNSTYPLDPPESLINFDHTDAIFTRNTVPMIYSDTPSRANEYKYDGITYEVAPSWPLQEGDQVEVRFF